MSTDVDEIPEEGTEDFSLQWAKDVRAVWRHLGKAAGRRALGSSAAKELHEMVMTDPKFKATFISQMAPKAEEIIAKHSQSDAPDALIQAERRPIAELQELLRESVEKSQEILNV